MLLTFTILYIISLVLFYLLNERVCLLTFVQFSFPSPPTSGNHKFDLIFCESVYLFSKYIWPTTLLLPQHSDWVFLYISKWSLPCPVTKCYHTKTLQLFTILPTLYKVIHIYIYTHTLKAIHHLSSNAF